MMCLECGSHIECGRICPPCMESREREVIVLDLPPWGKDDLDELDYAMKREFIGYPKGSIELHDLKKLRYIK